MRVYPAIELTWPTPPADEDVDLALAAIDDNGPLAVEHTTNGIRVFFGTTESQQAARSAVTTHLPHVAAAAVEVDDENWAERSQAQLVAVQVGDIVVAPPWHAPGSPVRQFPAETTVGLADAPASSSSSRSPIVIVVLPSMGFGTGHHPTTRLCLWQLQRHLRPGDAVLDVGTGSGVLAMAARALGASRVLGVDTDPDALANARENVGLTRLDGVEFAIADIAERPAEVADRFRITLANLTGALLARSAAALLGTLAPDGRLIASGYQPHERELVRAAFEDAGGTLVGEATELDWVGGVYRRRVG